ncbi:MAG: SH3 domain-containing protein [Alphaproteobacteria bacterium]
MRRLTARTAALLLALWIGCGLANAAEEARIASAEARLRATKTKFGETLRVLHSGESVTVLRTEAPWVRVSSGGVEGWLHESAISRGGSGGVALARALTGSEVEASERSAGQKGFDSATEQTFRASKPQLAAAFATIDRIDANRPDDAAIAAFVRAGGLSGGAR